MKLHLGIRKPLSRRTFLRGTGAALALPLLEAMRPPFLRAAETLAPPQRFAAICSTLGFHTPFLHPREVGAGYQPTPYLQPLLPFRDDFTVFSGLAHLEQNGANGHTSELSWLTSAKHPGWAGFRNTVSIDQFIAEKIGTRTRFPSLVLSTGDDSLSWSASGVSLPAEASPSRVFRQLFVEGTPAEVEAQLRGLRRGRSILDTVSTSAKQLQRDLGHADQQKLDEYLTAIRDLEGRLQQNEAWSTRPKPKIDAPIPTDIQSRTDAIGRFKLMLDLVVLAFQTDSTRVLTLRLSGLNAVPEIPGVSQDWHNLSHHGQDPAKIQELKIIELAEFTAFAQFLGQLKARTENGVPLLDHSAILFGSNLGNASAHDASNLPLVLAGGGFRHGRHLAVDPKKQVLSNLFVTLAQSMGVPADRFGFSTGSFDLAA